MKKLFSSIFSGASNASEQGLIEFSTSMEFEEFDAVLKHLSAIDRTLADEIMEKINKFKNSTVPGQSQKNNFEGVEGYVVLEREDDYAFGIATFTTEEMHSKINAAYEQGTKELGI